MEPLTGIGKIDRERIAAIIRGTKGTISVDEVAEILNTQKLTFTQNGRDEPDDFLTLVNIRMQPGAHGLRFDYYYHSRTHLSLKKNAPIS